MLKDGEVFRRRDFLDQAEALAAVWPVGVGRPTASSAEQRLVCAVTRSIEE
jgi:hypothetical protein